MYKKIIILTKIIIIVNKSNKCYYKSNIDLGEKNMELKLNLEKTEELILKLELINIFCKYDFTKKELELISYLIKKSKAEDELIKFTQKDLSFDSEISVNVVNSVLKKLKENKLIEEPHIREYKLSDNLLKLYCLNEIKLIFE